LFFGHDIGPGVVYEDPNIKVTAIKKTHFGFHKVAAASKHKSYSYRFDTSGRVIVFTSNTAPFDGLVELASWNNRLRCRVVIGLPADFLLGNSHRSATGIPAS
jgi:hypothetical protein